MRAYCVGRGRAAVPSGMRAVRTFGVAGAALAMALAGCQNTRTPQATQVAVAPPPKPAPVQRVEAPKPPPAAKPKPAAPTGVAKFNGSWLPADQEKRKRFFTVFSNGRYAARTTADSSGKTDLLARGNYRVSGDTVTINLEGVESGNSTVNCQVNSPSRMTCRPATGSPVVLVRA